MYYDQTDPAPLWCRTCREELDAEGYCSCFVPYVLCTKRHDRVECEPIVGLGGYVGPCCLDN